MKRGKSVTTEDTATAAALSMLKDQCEKSIDYIVVASLLNY